MMKAEGPKLPIEFVVEMTLRKAPNEQTTVEAIPIAFAYLAFPQSGEVHFRMLSVKFAQAAVLEKELVALIHP